MPRRALPLALLALSVIPAAADGQPPRPLSPLLAARSGPEKQAVDREYDGNQNSWVVISKGLIWLASQQQPAGYWEFDPRDPKLKSRDWATSTGLALLPFLAAGQTPAAECRHRKAVADALAWLRTDLNLQTGRFAHGSPQYMYGHGIATLALCEAYAQTGDADLKAPAQKAVDYIVKGQGVNGSWGYQAGTSGDTSITGWQLQALFAAKQGKLTVPDATVKNAVKFLDSVASGPTRAQYGYISPTGRPGTALTAVGLWCRYHFDGWTGETRGMEDGVAGLADPARRPKTAAAVKQNRVAPEMYFYYYATQVTHRAGGAAWRDWFLGPTENGKRVGGMRDWLTATQIEEGSFAGSWPPDAGSIGSHCGRVGTTALALLTLETPYRYLPLDRARPGGRGE